VRQTEKHKVFHAGSAHCLDAEAMSSELGIAFALVSRQPVPDCQGKPRAAPRSATATVALCAVGMRVVFPAFWQSQASNAARHVV
jgi:hypothetical protein